MYKESAPERETREQKDGPVEVLNSVTTFEIIKVSMGWTA